MAHKQMLFDAEARTKGPPRRDDGESATAEPAMI